MSSSALARATFLIVLLYTVAGYVHPCWFTGWSPHRQGVAKYVAEDYVPDLCSHIIYGYAKFDSSNFTVVAFDPSGELPSADNGTDRPGMIARVNDLKKKDRALKTLISIGGSSVGTRPFIEMSATAESRAIFIQSAIAFARRHRFDGIDIWWTHPRAEDRANFKLLFAELRTATEKEAVESGRERLLITVDLPSNDADINAGYDENVTEFSKNIDFMFLLTYDFYVSNSQISGLISGLYAGENETGDAAKKNVDFAVQTWLRRGAPKEKLVIGLPAHGRGWRLKDRNNTGVGATVLPLEEDLDHHAPRQPGLVTHAKICEMLADGAVSTWRIDAAAPYLLYKNNWFSYESEESVRRKMFYVKRLRLAGAFCWSLDVDDFNGQCHGPIYPLTRVIAKELAGVEIMDPIRPPDATALRRKLLSAVLITVSTLTLMFGIVTLFCRLRKMRERRQNKRSLLELNDQLLAPRKPAFSISGNCSLEAQIETMPYDGKFEINKDLLRIDEGLPLLGEGQFGQVFSGRLHSSSEQSAGEGRVNDTAFSAPLAVAIKIPRDGNNVLHQKALLIELKIMLAIGEHVNVLGLIGAVTKLMENGELYIVTELCALGNVQAFLRQKRSEFVDQIVQSHPFVQSNGYVDQERWSAVEYKAEPSSGSDGGLFDLSKRALFSTADLLSFGYQAANGMVFLGERKLIHRDLAARNLLLTADRTVKIADYGLARQYQTYHMKRCMNIPLPWKYMSLESILDRDFTVKSDVWSFGVVLWELFSLGLEPYAEQSLDTTFIDYLKAGNRMMKPAHAPQEIYELIKRCWRRAPGKRPSFSTCRQEIGQQLEQCNATYKNYLHERAIVRAEPSGSRS